MIPLLQSLIYTAQRAGGAIMAVYASGFTVRDKADMSPVTQADEAAEKIILEDLASIAPYVSEGHAWMVAKHGVFQGYYFWHHVGLDRNARDQYADSPYYDLTAEFCALYDQVAFDSTYVSNPLDHYVPLIHQFIN